MRKIERIVWRSREFEKAVTIRSSKNMRGRVRVLVPSFSKTKKIRHAAYYIEMLQLIVDTKSSKVIKQEQDRLNGIISSASYQPDGQMEIDYAIFRRNILGAFVESAAEYIMQIMQRWIEGKVELTMKRVSQVGSSCFKSIMLIYMKLH
ncbi:hypothetical protein HELRODRAFT_170385 [Helobdella robusta]|uniref:Uncharacterized protein n=1 Tax=Helobdella robusta TaxID=6412 RepID=T1F2Z6_HELRO|nr:hypothetical protein HELRODRAFT_170385 [Helobdella robusta]ESO07826.1 hypothetical protein HELRODRAFT_170385 [Helobdella robusta]